MFKDINAFKRESYGRHKSERLLDNNLYRFHKKKINEKIKEMNKMGKTEIKLEEDKVKKEAKIEENTQKRELDIETALAKILPHLNTKFCKSLKMITKLLKIGIKQFNEELILGLLLEFYDRISMFELDEDFDQLKQCFNTVLLYKNILIKKPESNDLLDIISLPCLTYSNLRETDDSFAFNNMIQEVKDEYFRFHKIVVEEQQYKFEDAMGVKVENEENDVEESEENIIEKIKDRTLKITQDENKLMNLKRESYIVFIKLIIKQAKVKKWSEIIIFNFVKEIFFNKDFIYNDEQKEKLSELMEKMHILKNQRNIKNKKLGFRDGKILENPLNSYHEVKDNREWQISMDGLDKWSYKQMGL